MMARAKKPCEWCDGDHFVTEPVDVGSNSHNLVIEFYPDNGLCSVASYAAGADEETDEVEVEFNFEYCPFCGRKIGW